VAFFTKEILVRDGQRARRTYCRFQNWREFRAEVPCPSIGPQLAGVDDDSDARLLGLLGEERRRLDESGGRIPSLNVTSSPPGPALLSSDFACSDSCERLRSAAK